MNGGNPEKILFSLKYEEHAVNINDATILNWTISKVTAIFTKKLTLKTNGNATAKRLILYFVAILQTIA
jgi:hypothetical protein